MDNQQQLLNNAKHKVELRGILYDRTDGSHAFQVLQPVFRQAYLRALRLRERNSSISQMCGISTNCLELAQYPPIIPFLEDNAPITVLFQEVEGILADSLNLAPEDETATTALLVTSKRIDRLDVHLHATDIVVNYLGNYYAFNFETALLLDNVKDD